jgi:hypothetical protein
MKRAIVAAALCAAFWTVAWTPSSAHSAGLDGLLMGVNGVLTFPADPICDAIFPTEDFEDFPGKTVLRYPLGFLFGTGLGIYRLTSGVLDIALTPLWVVPSASPVPRFDVIPGYELEEAE